MEDLELYLTDNTQAWILNADGRYHRVDKEESAPQISAQTTLLEQMAKSF
jgi:polyphosphate kinase